MRAAPIHSTVAWPAAVCASVFISSSSIGLAQTSLPPGAVSLINQDRHGSLIALCVDTGKDAVRKGSKTIRGTAVWVGEGATMRRVRAGLGACDPAWSPDGRHLALTAAEGLWVFPANSAEGDLRVESRPPVGAIESNYRAFSSPRWSPDGALVGLVVSNSGTSWIEVFEARSGRLFYTSPPENDTFSWNSARELKLRDTEVHLPR